MPAPVDLFEYIARGGLIEAQNSGFEFLIWNLVGVQRLGWPWLPQTALRCSMAKAYAFGLPGALDTVAKILQVSEQKDSAGKGLIKKFCEPRTPTKNNAARRILPMDEPSAYNDLINYNRQDIKTEAAVSAVIPGLSPHELEVWHTYQIINQRGVCIDVEALGNCT